MVMREWCGGNEGDGMVVMREWCGGDEGGGVVVMKEVVWW